jgi:hypothetical protein
MAAAAATALDRSLSLMLPWEMWKSFQIDGALDKSDDR